MDVLPRLTIAMILKWITPSKKLDIRAASVSVGRTGVSEAVTRGSNATIRTEDRLLARTAILAGIDALSKVTERCSPGAGAGKQWVRDNGPRFTMTAEQFAVAAPGASEPRSRWNSVRNSLAPHAKTMKVDIHSVGIVKTDDGVAFIPI